MLPRASSRHWQNQRGQITIGALILLPLILAIVVGLAIGAVAFTLEAKASGACRESILKSQIDAAEAINELLSYNTQAKFAERGVKAAEIGARVAVATGVGIVIAESVLLGAKAYQAYVMIQQKRWLFKGRSASWMAAPRAARAIREAMPQGFFGDAIRNIVDDFLGGDFTSLSTPRTKIARFKVIARPPNARTPEYYVAPDFEQSQLASVHWLLPIPTGSKIPLADFDFEPKIELGCAAGLKKGQDGKWYPLLTEDKLVSGERILAKRWWN